MATLSNPLFLINIQKKKYFAKVKSDLKIEKSGELKEFMKFNFNLQEL